MTLAELKVALTRGQRLAHVVIDPALAAAILDDDTPAQPTNPRKVRTFVQVLQAGRWNPGGIIGFTPDGRPVDGRHRLRAVVASGVALVVDVLPNQTPVPPAGKPRRPVP